MATLSYLSRVIVREHGVNTTWAATSDNPYKLACEAKQIDSPEAPPNMVDITTFENDRVTEQPGIKASKAPTVVTNYDKATYAALKALEGKKLDIIHMYGRDGLGGDLKHAYCGELVVTTNDLSGTDGVLEMTTTFSVGTNVSIITDTYTAAYVDAADITDGFTMTAVSP